MAAAERKPEKSETLVRLKPGQCVQVDGVVVRLERIQGDKAWLWTRRSAGPPEIARVAVDRESTAREDDHQSQVPRP